MTERSLDIKEYLSSGEYSFKDGVFFVPGVLRGAIYDLNSSNVYSINRSACNIITGDVENSDFWKKLELMNLVTKEEKDEKGMLPELLQNPSLQFVWFEIISDDCNESCIHCYAECMPPTYRKAVILYGCRSLCSLTRSIIIPYSFQLS